MKMYRTLGPGWAGYCIFMAVVLADLGWSLYWLYDESISADLCVCVGLILFFVAGAVASALLYRGAAWTRRLISLIALASAIYAVSCAVNDRFDWPFRGLCIFIVIYSAFSIVILLMPKRMVGGDLVTAHGDFITTGIKQHDYGMLVRVILSYAAWLMMVFGVVPQFISICIVIAAPMSFGGAIWHLRKMRRSSMVNQISFCGAIAFFLFLMVQIYLINRL